MNTITRTIAVATLAAGALAATPSANANEPTATPYAFETAPGCLGLHAGYGIDGYTVDGLFYDLPDTNEVKTITFRESGGLQGEYAAVALPGFAASNVEGAQMVTVAPGDGCGEPGAACVPAARVDRLQERLNRRADRIDTLRDRVQRLRDRLHRDRLHNAR